MKSNKLLYSSIALMAGGVVGLTAAVILEIATGEPVYYLMMKVAAGLFGVGGPLLGLAVAIKSRRDRRKK